MKSVLITGGSGFLGRALVRKLLADNLSDRICVFSRGEHTQADMRMQFNDDERLRFFIGDVRDLSRLRRAMMGCDVVIHAAALKRIEVGVSNPIEMVRTNVDGTVNIIEAAQDANVSKVMYISSDKAWRPSCSAYGQTKALSEILIINANNIVHNNGPKFSVCRYGNLAGSTGSILPKWNSMIKSGCYIVPVTNPECTRFWMRKSEAVDLILNTISTMHGGELAIPRLPAYRLGDLAEAMGVKMNIIGLPHFEKMHEGMEDGVTSDVARRMSVEELKEACDAVLREC